MRVVVSATEILDASIKKAYPKKIGRAGNGRNWYDCTDFPRRIHEEQDPTEQPPKTARACTSLTRTTVGADSFDWTTY